MNIDEEWENFISASCDDDISSLVTSCQTTNSSPPWTTFTSSSTDSLNNKRQRIDRLPPHSMPMHVLYWSNSSILLSSLRSSMHIARHCVMSRSRYAAFGAQMASHAAQCRRPSRPHIAVCMWWRMRLTDCENGASVPGCMVFQWIPAVVQRASWFCEVTSRRTKTKKRRRSDVDIVISDGVLDDCSTASTDIGWWWMVSHGARGGYGGRPPPLTGQKSTPEILPDPVLFWWSSKSP